MSRRRIRLLGRVSGLFCAIALLSVSSATAAGGGQPDLIVDGPWLASSVYQETSYWDPASCAVQEGELAAGTHTLLRFATRTENVGTADLKLGPPDKNDPADWVFYACHNHWHFVRYAEYTLTDLLGDVVGVGHKQSFCIEDSWPIVFPSKQPGHYTCKNQGISVGWSDIYTAALDGQWIVVDGVLPGPYLLTVTVNYASVLPESNYANNSVTVPVSIS